MYTEYELGEHSGAVWFAVSRASKDSLMRGRGVRGRRFGRGEICCVPGLYRNNKIASPATIYENIVMLSKYYDGD